MKLSLVLLLICLYVLPFTVSAQHSSKMPKWLSNKGFWILETQRSTPKNSIVYFYNNEQVLIYKETINNKRINVARKKVRKQLEAVLEQALASWQKEKVAKENDHWVASRL